MENKIINSLNLINIFSQSNAVLTEGRECAIHYNNLGFIIESEDFELYPKLDRETDICFSMGENNFIASRASLTTTHKFSYFFRNIISGNIDLETEKVFCVTCLKIIPKEGSFFHAMLAKLNRLELAGQDNKITLSVCSHNYEYYLIISTLNPLSFAEMIDITVRIAQSICFVHWKFSFSNIILLWGNDCVVISTGMQVNTNRQQSIFIPPWNFDVYKSIPCDKRTEFFQKYTPDPSPEFIRKIIDISLEKDYFLLLLLFTSDPPEADVYIRTATMMIALEMLAHADEESVWENEKLREKLRQLNHEIPKLVQKLFPNDREVEEYVNKKLAGFLTPPNADQLKKLCTKLGLVTDKIDERTLRLRNVFLHGKISKNDYDVMQNIKSYFSASRLVYELMARTAGYTGYICKFDRALPPEPNKPALSDVYIWCNYGS